MDSSTTRPGRPRDDKSRNSILRAALRMVKESGYRSLTIEGIARRAGAGKTTIYRWWPSKAAIVMEAFLHYISPKIQFPTGAGLSAAATIRRQMQAVARAYTGPHGELLRALIAEAQLDPELAHAFVTGWILPRRQMARAILQSGVATGEIGDHVNLDVAIDALYGGLYYRFLIPYKPLTARFARQLADNVLLGLVRKPSTKRP